MTRKQRTRALAEAQGKESLIWVARRDDRRWWRGFVVGLSDDWALLHTVASPTLRLNGYLALRIADLERVEEDETFVPYALKLRGERPVPQPDLLLIDLPGLLSSAGALFPLVTLYQEKARPGVCWIGRVVRLGRKSVRLQTVGRSGAWSAVRKLRYRDVTRIEMGDGYSDALWLVAGRQRRPASEGK